MKDFDILVGYFVSDLFKWKKIKSFDSYASAVKEFKKFTTKHLNMSEKDLTKEWNSPRIDVEIMQGNKMLMWAGIYNSESKLDNKDKGESNPISETEVGDSVVDIKGPLRFTKREEEK